MKAQVLTTTRSAPATVGGFVALGLAGCRPACPSRPGSSGSPGSPASNCSVTAQSTGAAVNRPRGRGYAAPGAKSRAEREGFEPSDPVSQVNSLAVSPIRPLSHLSNWARDDAAGAFAARPGLGPACHCDMQAGPRPVARRWLPSSRARPRPNCGRHDGADDLDHSHDDGAEERGPRTTTSVTGGRSRCATVRKGLCQPWIQSLTLLEAGLDHGYELWYCCHDRSYETNKCAEAPTDLNDAKSARLEDKGDYR